MINVRVSDCSKPFGQFNRPRVRTAYVARGETHLAHLLGSRVGQLGAAITRGVIPKPRQAVDKTIAIGIDQVCPLATNPHPCT